MAEFTLTNGQQMYAWYMIGRIYGDCGRDATLLYTDVPAPVRGTILYKKAKHPNTFNVWDEFTTNSYSATNQAISVHVVPYDVDDMAYRFIEGDIPPIRGKALTYHDIVKIAEIDDTQLASTPYTRSDGKTCPGEMCVPYKEYIANPFLYDYENHSYGFDYPYKFSGPAIIPPTTPSNTNKIPVKDVLTIVQGTLDSPATINTNITIKQTDTNKWLVTAVTKTSSITPTDAWPMSFATGVVLCSWSGADVSVNENITLKTLGSDCCNISTTLTYASTSSDPSYPFRDYSDTPLIAIERYPNGNNLLMDFDGDMEMIDLNNVHTGTTTYTYYWGVRKFVSSTSIVDTPQKQFAVKDVINLTVEAIMAEAMVKDDFIVGGRPYQMAVSGTTMYNSNVYNIYTSQNKGVASTNSYTKITFSGLTSITVVVRSRGETNYDYLTVSALDATGPVTSATSTSSTCVLTTYGSKNNFQWYSYTFSGLQKNSEHCFYVNYKKDGSGDSGEDIGQFFLIYDDSATKPNFVNISLSGVPLSVGMTDGVTPINNSNNKWNHMFASYGGRQHLISGNTYYIEFGAAAGEEFVITNNNKQYRFHAYLIYQKQSGVSATTACSHNAYFAYYGGNAYKYYQWRFDSPTSGLTSMNLPIHDGTPASSAPLTISGAIQKGTTPGSPISFQGSYTFATRSSLTKSVTIDMSGLKVYEVPTCLLNDTLVNMADGTTKQIGDIEVGDMVLSLDYDTKKLIPRKVIYTNNEHDLTAEVYDVWTFENGYTVKTAHEHEFYCVEEKKMKYLSTWEIGQHAYTIDGEKVALLSHETINDTCHHSKITLEGEGCNNFFANGLLNGDRYCPSFEVD